MECKELIALNTKWYRYKQKLTQEQLAEIANLKTASISLIENANDNITVRKVDTIAKSLNIKPMDLFNEDTAQKAKILPKRIDMYNI